LNLLNEQLRARSFFEAIATTSERTLEELTGALPGDRKYYTGRARKMAIRYE
jgi:hypothetical protein